MIFDQKTYAPHESRPNEVFKFNLHVNGTDRQREREIESPYKSISFYILIHSRSKVISISLNQKEKKMNKNRLKNYGRETNVGEKKIYVVVGHLSFKIYIFCLSSGVRVSNRVLC